MSFIVAPTPPFDSATGTQHPDEIWDEAARHYDEPARAAPIIAIATINVWNRLNVATREVTGRVLNDLLDNRPCRLRKIGQILVVCTRLQAFR